MASNVWSLQMDYFQQDVVVFLEETFAEFSRTNTNFTCSVPNTIHNIKLIIISRRCSNVFIVNSQQVFVQWINL